MKLASRILRNLGLKSAAWDAEFKTDHWDRGTKDDLIYQVIEKYPGSMLELGCGTALTPFETHRTFYTGIDVSPVAILKARTRNAGNPRHEFYTDTMEDYRPYGRYSVILFRESIYYVKKVNQLLGRLASHLEPEGVFVVRICSRERHRDVIDEINHNWWVRENVFLPTGGIIMTFNLPSPLTSSIRGPY